MELISVTTKNRVDRTVHEGEAIKKKNSVSGIQERKKHHAKIAKIPSSMGNPSERKKAVIKVEINFNRYNISFVRRI